MQVRLIDSFGDNGMICVIICRLEATGEWIIDTWLMSCRVLGRKVEQMVLREVLLQAREAGIDRLRGRFIPTEKNALVRDHYEKLGFTKIGERDGTTTWVMPVSTDVAEVPMRVTRSHATALAA